MVDPRFTVGPAVADPGVIESVRSRLCAEEHRYVAFDHSIVIRGLVELDMQGLVELVAEILSEYTDHVIAERDALAEDLAWEINACQGRGRPGHGPEPGAAVAGGGR